MEYPKEQEMMFFETLTANPKKSYSDLIEVVYQGRMTADRAKDLFTTFRNQAFIDEYDGKWGSKVYAISGGGKIYYQNLVSQKTTEVNETKLKKLNISNARFPLWALIISIASLLVTGVFSYINFQREVNKSRKEDSKAKALNEDIRQLEEQSKDASDELKKHQIMIDSLKKHP